MVLCMEIKRKPFKYVLERLSLCLNLKLNSPGVPDYGHNANYVWLCGIGILFTCLKLKEHHPEVYLRLLLFSGHDLLFCRAWLVRDKFLHLVLPLLKCFNAVTQLGTNYFDHCITFPVVVLEWCKIYILQSLVFYTFLNWPFWPVFDIKMIHIIEFELHASDW